MPPKLIFKKQGERNDLERQAKVLRIFEKGGEIFGSKSQKSKQGKVQARVGQSKFTSSRAVHNSGAEMWAVLKDLKDRLTERFSSH